MNNEFDIEIGRNDVFEPTSGFFGKKYQANLQGATLNLQAQLADLQAQSQSTAIIPIDTTSKSTSASLVSGQGSKPRTSSNEYSSNESVSTQSLPTSTKSNKKIIIGISVGAGVLALAGLAFFLIKRK